MGIPETQNPAPDGALSFSSRFSLRPPFFTSDQRIVFLGSVKEPERLG
jgi:hypothetical protein